MVSSISTLNNVASENLITIKAQVVNIAATKVVNMQYQRTLKKQEVLITDPTSSIKVILWESYVDTLTLNSTYIFRNLKVKLSKNKNERHLNTAKDVSFYTKKTAPFTQPLIDVNRELASMVTSTINGKIIGFLEINTGVCRGLYQYVHIPPCSPRWNDLSGLQSSHCPRSLLYLFGTTFSLHDMQPIQSNSAD